MDALGLIMPAVRFFTGVIVMAEALSGFSDPVETMKTESTAPDTATLLELMFRLGQAYLACGEGRGCDNKSQRTENQEQTQPFHLHLLTP
jgi:hypothetical protein